jgi:MFS family permease
MNKLANRVKQMARPPLERLRIGAFAPFRYPEFRSLWMATFIANTGYWAQSVGLAWWLVEQKQVAAVVVLAHTATAGPVLLLSYLAGILADRYERLNVQYAAQLGSLLMAAMFTLVASKGPGSVALILLLAAGQGVGAAVRGPAWQASIGDMLPDRLVAAGTALSSLGFNLSRVAGPLLGGVLISSTGVSAAFGCNVLSAAVLAATLARCRAKKAPPSSARPAPSPDGLRYIRRSPVIRAACVRAISIGLPASALLALLPVLSAEALPGDPGAYTALLCAFGAGGVIAAFVLPWFRDRYRPETTLGVATLLFAAGLAVLAGWPAGGIAVAAAITAGTAWLTLFSTLNALVQRHAVPAYRGRAVAMYMTLAFGGMAGGGVLWGHVADALGPGHALRLAACLLLACSWPVSRPVLALSPAATYPGTER